MKITSLARIGAKHVRGHFAEALLARTGLDFTRPLVFSANVAGHCNIRCRYCACWRQEHDPSELTIDEWKTALLNVSTFAGAFSISFTGGEPFLKPGFLDLLSWCQQKFIYSGVTTNGTLLSEVNIQQLVRCHPWNVNISIDAVDEDINDYLRGKSGLFAQVSSAVRRLVATRNRLRARFPIIIKPTVTARNFRHLVDLVEWTARVGVTCVYLQPVDRWTPETYHELWIEADQLSDLAEVCEQLVRKKREGAPILNAEPSIRRMVEHFREQPAERRARHCIIHGFAIQANGDVAMCPCSPILGNLLRQPARDIWYGPTAREFRRNAINSNCLNLNTSATPKSLREKMRIGRRLLFG